MMNIDSRATLSRLFKSPVKVTERTPGKGVAYVIPTCRSGSATTIHIALESIADQEGTPGVKRRILVADNGIDLPTGRSIVQQGRALGLALEVVDASDQRGAGHARNKAIDHVIVKENDRPEDRSQFLIFIDDDVMMGPRAERSLVATAIDSQAAAVTSNALLIPPTDLNGYRQLRANAVLSDDPIIRIPPLISSEGVDMVAIAAFGSLVSAKTNCSLMDNGLVHDIKRSHGTFFIKRPGNTMEDVLATVLLQRNGGVIYQDPNIKAWDMQRDQLNSMMSQQSTWAYDHMMALADFAHSGMAKSGIRVLQPKGSGWEEIIIPSESTGVIVNPAEVKKIQRFLRSQMKKGELSYLPDGLTIADIYDGLAVLDRVFVYIDARKAEATRIQRTDLPARRPLDQSVSRNRLDQGGVARLLGQIKGIKEASSLGNHVPDVFLYGMRQGGLWTVQ